MCADDDIDFDDFDYETLVGHYLIASMDGRGDDQDLIGQELIRRSQMSESLHQRHMQMTRDRPPLPRPIIAGPNDNELADWHRDNEA